MELFPNSSLILIKKTGILPNKYNTNQPKLDVKYNASNPWKVISQTFTGDASVRQNDCVGHKF